MSKNSISCTLLVPAVIIAIIGLILCFIGIATPSWQVVYARELQQLIQSGLWINCQTRPSGMYTCTYTFSETDYNFYTSTELVNFRTPPFYSWQRKLLYSILCGQLIGIIGLFTFCSSFYQPIAKKCALFYTITIGITSIIHIITSIIFTIFAHMVEYRFFHVSVSGIYEKHKGYSFYVHLIGGILLFLSFIISIIHVIIQFKNKHIERVDDYDRNFNGYNKNIFNEFQYYNNPRENILQQPPQRYHGYADSFTGSGSWHGSQDFRMQEYDQVPRFNYRY
ncbi:Clc protein-like family-containing protein [Strongyloides ratti]|uniref:Clc protein-like family-containing protein n=1 Tax=Strongyloides ratti TaxID=34506 RepID=A0A090L7K1_STRRB|nr:Clc protein-like family-containing protein [Strongyloides ratti]CEF64113.1 Clc protein-like family-containing protein [Strongyloides ratti]